MDCRRCGSDHAKCILYREHQASLCGRVTPDSHACNRGRVWIWRRSRRCVCIYLCKPMPMRKRNRRRSAGRFIHYFARVSSAAISQNNKQSMYDHKKGQRTQRVRVHIGSHDMHVEYGSDEAIWMRHKKWHSNRSGDARAFLIQPMG